MYFIIQTSELHNKEGGKESVSQMHRFKGEGWWKDLTFQNNVTRQMRKIKEIYLHQISLKRGGKENGPREHWSQRKGRVLYM